VACLLGVLVSHLAFTACLLEIDNFIQDLNVAGKQLFLFLIVSFSLISSSNNRAKSGKFSSHLDASLMTTLDNFLRALQDLKNEDLKTVGG
jgi:hypothetical protein